MITVEIPGEPFAQPRQRHQLRHGHDGRAFAHSYQPTAAIRWKAAAQVLMRSAFGGRPPFVGAVSVVITAFFACPRSQWRTREPRPAKWHMGAKDCDNIAKAVLDSAQSVWFLNDAQVASLTVHKIVAAQGEPSRVIVEVRELGALSGERPAAPAASGELPFVRSAADGGGR